MSDSEYSHEESQRSELLMMEKRIETARQHIAEKVNNLSKLKESLKALEVEEAKCREEIRMELNNVIDEEEFENVEQEIDEKEKTLENLKAEHNFVLTDLENIELVYMRLLNELDSLPVVDDDTIAAAERKLKKLQMEEEAILKLVNKKEKLKQRLNEMKHKADAMASSYEQKLNEWIFLMMQSQVENSSENKPGSKDKKEE